MKTTELSKCLIRKIPIFLTPEEKVRQKLLFRMVEGLGFPRGLLSVEKKVGGRRFDIVCFCPDLQPLLIIECKGEGPSFLSERAFEQAAGYNEKMQAPFIAIAIGEKIRTFWMEASVLKSVWFLPQYRELCRYVFR